MSLRAQGEERGVWDEVLSQWVKNTPARTPSEGGPIQGIQWTLALPEKCPMPPSLSRSLSD